MKRRTALGALAAVAATPRAAPRLSGRSYRIGLLGARNITPWETFRNGLRELGYVEDRNVVFEGRWSEGFSERLPALARDLAARLPDVIVTSTSLATAAASAATRTIPIVMTIASHPRELGLVHSYSAPGGNVTGLATDVPGIAAKRIQLLRELAPRVARLAVLCSRTNTAERLQFEDLQQAAVAAGATVDAVEFEQSSATASVIGLIGAGRADALVALFMPATVERSREIAGLAYRSHLPSLFEDRLFVEGGGLLSYGPSAAELFRRAATYVDRILRGAKAAELPIELPVRFEFVLNRGTAAHLRLPIPKSLLARADAVID
jgi:putative tryptophan/tyrosine transport system substrate-binding protein